MKKVLLSLVLTISTMFSSVWAYGEVDFTATAPSGQTLYFYITTHTSQYSSVSVAGWDVYYGDSISIIGNLVIPSSVTYNGMIYSVTTIYEGAFQGGRDLTSITIPNSITSIEHAAFAGCTGLTSITIPNSVTTIEYHTFEGCTGLTSVTIPNSVTTIESYAFAGCSGLTSVTIPNSVTTIGGRAFEGVINIVYYGTATDDYNHWGARYRNKYYENGFVYEDSTKTILLKYVGTDTNVTIPNSVTTIGGSAFAGCSGLTSVTIPNSVDTIGYYAFSNTGLTSITIPENVKYVGGTAFGNYESEIPSSLTTVVWNAKDATMETNNYGYTYSPFYGCSNISTVTFGDSVKVIPNYIFYNCSSLTSVNIGNNVSTVGDYAFDGCTGLTSVTLPNSVDTIGAQAFYNTGLTSITIPENVKYIGNNAFGVDYSRSSSLTTVVWNAKNASFYNDGWNNYSPFEGCSNISTVTFGDSVRVIYDDLFNDIASNITPNVYYGRDIESWINIERQEIFQDRGGLFRYTNYNLYINNQLVTNLVIPNTIDTIQDYTFYHCNSIQSVTIPEHIEFIGRYAFFCPNINSLTWNAINCNLEGQIFGDYNALNITSLVLGDSVQVIPDEAFVVLGITNVNLPASLTTIGASAFLGCVNLASITIPSQVTTIGNHAFAECGNLRSITMEPTVPPTIYTGTFYGVGTGVSVNVPCGTVEDYSSAAFWFNFSNIRQSSECVRTITAMSLNTSQGTVLGGGTYEYGSTATIAAIPKSGYQFYQWNDGDITNPRSLVVSTDSSFIATFSSITTGGGVVHDTLYVDRYIYDTIYTTIHDTVSNTVHDTVTNTVFDTITNTVYDTIDNFIYDTVYVTETDTLWLFDTIYMHDTIYIYDTIYIRDSTTGIENVSMINAKIYSSRSRIVVEGAEGNNVMLFDMQGRLLSTKQDEYSVLEFEVPISGAYFVKIGNYKAKKVVVIK